MAARKKKEAASPTAHEFTIVLEDIRTQFRVFGEALHGIGGRLDGFELRFEQIDRRFEQIDRRFEQIDRRFEQIDRRFEQIDRRFDGIEARMDRVESDLALVKVAVLEHGQELREIRTKVTRIDEALAAKVDRDEIEPIVERLLARR